MNYVHITSPEQFDIQLKEHPALFLLIYKADSEQSQCALQNLNEIDKSAAGHPIFVINASAVKGVHTRYNITSAPTLIEFKEGKPARMLKGCHQPGALTSFFNSHASTVQPGERARQKQVIVYSTPTCSWCRTLKDYLRNHNIRFRDVDVSKDEKAAAEMVKRSGQQGVPQSIIDGQVIVGFDRNRIDRLLNIN